MDTTTFWTTVGLIATALLITTPLARRALRSDSSGLVALRLAGALAGLSFTIDAGPAAALMTLPWLGVGSALLLGELRATGLARLLRRPNTVVTGEAVTWSWMAAGACWLTAHRLGIEPLGFDRPIALLTVAHFHVAGLGVSALLAVTHRHRPGRLLLTGLWLHQAGMLTVAAGLTFSDPLEVVGAVTITVALGIWAAVVVSWCRDGLAGRARALLGVAAAAWILPMALALGWALAPFLPEPVVTTFATMLRFHAALQTFGLVLCGLAGVILAETARPDASGTTGTTSTTATAAAAANTVDTSIGPDGDAPALHDPHEQETHHAVVQPTDH